MERPLVADPDIVFRKEEEDAILFDPRNGEVTILNETGAFIYQLLDGKHPQAEIVDLLIDTFDIANRTDVEKDVQDFMTKVQESNLAGESVNE